MRWQFIFVVLFSVVFYSCENDLSNIGEPIQPAGDAIILNVDSFDINSQNIDIPFIYSKPDSLLLGTFVDDTYGTLSADILTQLQPPVGVKFPENAKADSAKLIMVYFSWFGDQYSPLEVNVYQMDKGLTFEKSKYYPSNIKYEDYCSKTRLMGSKVFTATDYAGGRASSKMIEIKLDTSNIFVKNGFTAEMRKEYTLDNVANFHRDFNGIYITTKFGSASLLNISAVYMRYYYHYTYKRNHADGTPDSTVVVSHYQDYPANEEVTTVNRLVLPEKTRVLNAFNSDASKNVVAAPANIYTSVTLPFSTINNRTNAGVSGKTRLINRAILKVNVADVADTTLAVPLVSNILLINEDSVDNYFKTRKLPSSYISAIASLSSEYDSDNNVQYYYKFDLSKILTRELSKSNNKAELKFRLVPVAVTYDGSKNIKSIKQQNLMRAVKFYSGSSAVKPMKLQMVYSGF